MKICFLIHRNTPLTQAVNVLPLVNASLELKHDVSLAFIDTLSYYHEEVRADAAHITTPLSKGVEFTDIRFAPVPLTGFDAVWVISLGQHRAFLDNIQLLKLLGNRVQIINSLEGLLFLRSKISLAYVEEFMKYPQSYISPDADELWNIVNKSNAPWILKQLTESFGRNVFKLMPDDSNVRLLLKTMTGWDKSRHCLLQRYLPEVEKGEKHVLIAGGEIIGQYLNKSANTDQRGDPYQGTDLTICELLPQERASCKRVAAYLLEKGVYIAELNIAWPWLLEWNVVNPDAIAIIEKLGGGNLAKTVVESALSASGAQQRPLPAGANPAVKKPVSETIPAAPVAPKMEAPVMEKPPAPVVKPAAPPVEEPQEEPEVAEKPALSQGTGF